MGKSRNPLDPILDVIDRILPGGNKGKKDASAGEADTEATAAKAEDKETVTETEANAKGPGQQGDSKKGSAKPKKQLTEKEKTRRDLIRLIRKIVILAAIVIVLLFYVGGLYMSHNNYMEPAIRDGDLAIIYRLGDCYNGDVVVYEEEDTIRFGRVIGIPGDTIDIDGSGTYTINGTVPMETNFYKTYPANESSISYPYTVKDGEVFILNDLRENVRDSRIYGGVDTVKGKVVLLIRRRGF